MEPKETIITTPVGSDTAGVGELHNIVPVAHPSSLDDGQNAVYVAGTAQDIATVTTILERESTATNVAECSLTEHSVPISVEPPDRPRQDTMIMTPSPERIAEIISLAVLESWVNLVEKEEKMSLDTPGPPINMEIEDDGPSLRTAPKRKKTRNMDSDSLDDSASDAARGPTLRTRPLRKRTPVKMDDQSATTSKDCEVQVCSNPDSALSGTDREDRQGKVGRSRRKIKAVDPILAEKEILKKTGVAPEYIEEEVLQMMTASEVCAQDLEYMSSIELVRTKCGRIQGGLSGELRKRTHGLRELIRALQAKAEAKGSGDPCSLKFKIEKLLDEAGQSKKDREKEEERRKREISELQKIIKD